MEQIIKYLFRNFKYAGKNVFSKMKAYLPFFVAFFVIQAVFFTTFVTTATNYQNRHDTITEKYDYDMLISNLTYNDYIVLEEKLYYNSYLKNRSFESYKISKVSDGFGEEWRIYVLMKDGTSTEDFLNYFIYLNGNLTDTSHIEVTYTPLNEYRNTASITQKTPSILLLIAMTLISAGAVLTLYDVQVNQDRFRYGVYMAFGAGFKRLISTSVFEMIVVAIVSLIPSGAFVFGVSTLFYGKHGITPVFEYPSAIKVMVMSVIVAAIGVYLPMLFLSKKTPMSLIIAEDNSNLISSPRRTKFVVGERFLKIYESLGMWRFRKYYLKLLASAVAFSAIFLCGYYITYMNNDAAGQSIEELRFDSKKEQTQLSSHSANYEQYLKDLDFFYDSFIEMDGVASVEYNVESTAVSSGSIALLTNRMGYRSLGDMANIKNATNPFEETDAALKKYSAEGYVNATYMYKYQAFDENMLRVLDEKYEIEGDVFSVLNNDNTVIISEKTMNTQKYRFEVGDKIILCRITEMGEEAEFLDPFDTVGIVGEMLKRNNYSFNEYTVGAVIKDAPEVEGYFTVGLSYDEYLSLVKRKPVPTGASVYLDSDVTEEEYNAVSLKASQIINYYSHDFTLTDTYGYLYNTLEVEECAYGFGLVLSFLVLMISPIVWFYSQSLFYKKRSKEMYVLAAYGATQKVFKKIHMTSGKILSVIGFIFTTILGLISSYLVFKMMNEWLVFLGFGSNVNYEFYISPIALAICLIVSALCGFLSAYLPYRSTVKVSKAKKVKNKKAEAEIEEA